MPKVNKDKCPGCGAEVKPKYASKRACQLIECLTGGLIKAKDAYFSLPSGPILTDPGHGGLHKCGTSRVNEE